MNVIAFIIGEAIFLGICITASFLGGGGFEHFLDYPSLIFVLPGSIAILIMGFSLNEISNAFSHAFGKEGDREQLQKSAYFWKSSIWILNGIAFLGTLIGWIAMGANLSEITAIGPSFSVSILTNLYGLGFSFMLPVPALLSIKKRISQ